MMIREGNADSLCRKLVLLIRGSGELLSGDYWGGALALHAQLSTYWQSSAGGTAVMLGGKPCDSTGCR